MTDEIDEAAAQAAALPPAPGPYLSLADGWDAQAADLRRRAKNLSTKAYRVRAGLDQLSAVYVGDSPSVMDEKATRNDVAATVLEQAARELRAHHDAVTRYAAADAAGWPM